jgi:hypothetical protein
MSARHTSRLLLSNLRPATRLAQLQLHTRPSLARTMASIPRTMKGVLIEKTGGVKVLQWKTDLPVPTPKEGEVLVKNDFIGINYIDTFVPLPSISLHPIPLLTPQQLLPHRPLPNSQTRNPRPRSRRHNPLNRPRKPLQPQNRRPRRLARYIRLRGILLRPRCKSACHPFGPRSGRSSSCSPPRPHGPYSNPGILPCAERGLGISTCCCGRSRVVVVSATEGCGGADDWDGEYGGED